MNEEKNPSFIHVKVCFISFILLCICTILGCIFSKTGLPDTIARPLTEKEQSDIVSRNSPMISYIYLSPNANFPRTDKIRKITIHHMAGNLALDHLGYAFAEQDRNASTNYAIDSDGNVALYVEECNRSFSSSSPENDQQAITIEVANDEIGGIWHVSDKAYETLIALCVDICQRNGIEELNWTGDATGNLTVHSMFSSKTECPGTYLLSRMFDIADSVNRELRSNGDVIGDSLGSAVSLCRTQRT